MTPKQVVRKKLSIESKIDKLNASLEQLKETCSHYSLRYRNQGSSGGWDSEGSYWIDWYCQDCEKRWNTGQTYIAEQDVLKTYPHATKIDRYNQPKEYENFYNKFKYGPVA